jgi:transketolase
MCVAAQTGHVTSSFSAVEIMACLYFGGILRHRPGNPAWAARDRFVLSKGQASPLLYVVLAEAGFFPRRWLRSFCAKDGHFGVHLQENVPGVEITSGSLGHGLGISTGMALAARMDKKDSLTYCLLGDGECYEGSVWEAAMFAAHHNLDNLVAIIDRNRLCVTNFTEELVRLAPLDEKWRSFGWDVRTVDGHNVGELLEALADVRARRTGRPYVLIAETVKGKGVSFLENQILTHGIAPRGQEADRAKAELRRPGRVL